MLILLYFVLVGFGWMNIYAASSTDTSQEIFDMSTKYGKQLLWISLSIPLIIFILFFNSKFYERFASLLYLISITSLIGLFLFGKNINGATSWYNFGGIGIQPSEFAKAFTALAVAKLMSDRQYNLKLMKNQIKAFIIIFTPAFFITLQPDPGSALIYLSFFFVLNREGLTLSYIILGFLAILLFLLTLFFGSKIILLVSFGLITIFILYGIYKNKQFLRFNGLRFLFIYGAVGLFILGVGFAYNNIFEQRHRDRFDVLLGRKVDTKNIGYNSYQSELTISSGGFLGKGYLQGDRTQGDFVPEQHTDYIFSTVGEEWGFLGSSVVIILFIFLLYRIIYLAEKHTNKFGRIYGYGIASILFFHVIVNIGMVIGLLPTVGIPLPFFSYGGSGLWGFTLLLFIFIRLDAHKKYDW
ncbi:rod shape determining protein RodA [Tenacibaculum adriaticum]|uniref:Rod shape determining protein RodA n=1 Tax=Tenacibaculum adriaticum TaxID=413713 RepID=A0A5S5DX64_9FLAO|nr:rod shape determining protein RodA [Tenacibaculum adriaticum]